MGDSLKRIRAFAKPVRQQAGYELELVQHDMEPSDWKPAALCRQAETCGVRTPRFSEEEPEDIQGRYRTCKDTVSGSIADGGAEKMIRQRSRHDVFTDLGFPPPEAENLRIRSAMMRALVASIRKEELTQAQAAKRLGVTQPRISDLMRGKIHLFSIDNLVVLLAAAGLRVDLKVKRAA
jgi:predicted XRE-type DNA-binding protein